MAEGLRAAILARCDEFGTARAERRQRRRLAAGGGQWEVTWTRRGPIGEVRLGPTGLPPVAESLPPAATHIAMWDPAAVCALVAGAREMVALHAADSGAVRDGWSAWCCNGCGDDDTGAYLVEDCPTLAALARMLGVAAVLPIAEMPVAPDVDDREFTRAALTLLGSLSPNQRNHAVWVTGMPMLPVLGRLANSDGHVVWVDTQNPPRVVVLNCHVIFTDKIGSHVMQLWDERLVDVAL